MRSLRFALLASVAFLSAPDASAQQGGIEVFAAETLFARGTRTSLTWISRRQGTLYDGSDEISDPTDSSFEEQRLVLGVDHGITGDLTFSALLPYVSNELDTNSGDANASGLGDLAMLAKYRFYQKDWKRSALNLAVVGGIETPTGRTDVTENGVRLPPGLQPGLGSWNPFAGLSTTMSIDRTRFDALAFYKVNTEGAQDFEQGDFFSLRASGAYRFWHTKYPGPTASAGLGLTWRHEAQARFEGQSVTNSGFDQILLRPGLSWHPKPGIDISLTVELPVYQHYEGVQLGLDYRTFLAFGIRF